MNSLKSNQINSPNDKTHQTEKEFSNFVTFFLQKKKQNEDENGNFYSLFYKPNNYDTYFNNLNKENIVNKNINISSLKSDRGKINSINTVGNSNIITKLNLKQIEKTENKKENNNFIHFNNKPFDFNHNQSQPQSQTQNQTISPFKISLNLPIKNLPKLDESSSQKFSIVENKKECSEIIPNFLYLSGQDVSLNIEILNENRITHIINAAAEICESSYTDKFKYLNLYLRDQSNEKIECCFYSSYEFIEQARLLNGRVLVHCVQGISRSSTIVISYLVISKKFTCEEAMNYVQSKRGIISPNFGFFIQIQDFYNRVYLPYDELKVKPKIFAVGFLNPSFDVVVCRYVSQ